jgi:hypothetical protein
MGTESAESPRSEESSLDSVEGAAAVGRHGGFPIGPLLWIVLTPLLTIPLTLIATGVLTPFDGGPYSSFEDVQAAAAADPYCTVSVSGADILGGLGAQATCQDGLVLLCLSPGLINVLPILWLLSRKPETQLAALLASILGVFRLVVPTVAVLTLAPKPGAGCLSADFCALPHGFTVIDPGYPWAFPNSWNDAPWISVGLWLLTVIVYVAFRARFSSRLAVEAVAGPTRGPDDGTKVDRQPQYPDRDVRDDQNPPE